MSSWFPSKQVIVKAFCVWIAIALVDYALQDSAITTWLTQQAYAFLQSNLPLDRRPEMPVVIVDISHWRTTNELVAVTEVPGLFVRSGWQYTDRLALQTLVSRLALLEPATIGIDIDFSPMTPAEGGNGAPPPHHVDFLDTCKDLKTPSGSPIPVFLGVMRTMHLSPDGWLGSTEHKDLASSIARFRGIGSHLPYDLQIQSGAPVLPSLAKATAEAFLRVNKYPPIVPAVWLRPFVEGDRKEFVSDRGIRSQITSFPVNYYSTLPALEDSRIPAEDILQVKGDKQNEIRKKLYRKIVMIGYATRLESFDTIALPNEPDPVPGIYMHACGAATLVAKPLFEINEFTGLTLSLLCSIIVFLTMFRLGATSLGARFGTVAINLLLLLAASAVSLGFALALVHWAGVLWLQVTVLWFFMIVEFGLEVFATGPHKGP